jgi:hypothetical protein
MGLAGRDSQLTRSDGIIHRIIMLCLSLTELRLDLIHLLFNCLQDASLYTLAVSSENCQNGPFTPNSFLQRASRH